MRAVRDGLSRDLATGGAVTGTPSVGLPYGLQEPPCCGRRLLLLHVGSVSGPAVTRRDFFVVPSTTSLAYWEGLLVG